jgi:hypothetical protein
VLNVIRPERAPYRWTASISSRLALSNFAHVSVSGATPATAATFATAHHCNSATLGENPIPAAVAMNRSWNSQCPHAETWPSR